LIQKIKVGAVSYLNTKPLIYGFEQGMMKDEIELMIDYPFNIAKKLLDNEIDIGLVPVVVLPEMKTYQIISDYCIGCIGAVESVCLFSDVPLPEIETVLLDYQSKTSIALLKILIAKHWKINPKINIAEKGYEDKISGTTAGLVIGDRAFKQTHINKYSYDLGLAWQQFTGMPFVFAIWVSNKKLSKEFITEFNLSTGYGIKHVSEIASLNAGVGINLQEYYTKYISYPFDENKKAALAEFLQLYSAISLNA
jgi:chorismate dehydratase